MIMTNHQSEFDLSKKNRLDKLCQKYEYDGSDQGDDWLQTAGCKS